MVCCPNSHPLIEKLLTDDMLIRPSRSHRDIHLLIEIFIYGASISNYCLIVYAYIKL